MGGEEINVGTRIRVKTRCERKKGEDKKLNGGGEVPAPHTFRGSSNELKVQNMADPPVGRRGQS